MPIGIDEFESHDPDERPTNAECVLGFLARNPDQAFKAVEIADATDVNGNSIHPVLNRLRDRDLVHHKEPYWTIGDLETVRDAVVFSSTAAFLDDDLGPESREAWRSASEENAETGE